MYEVRLSVVLAAELLKLTGEGFGFAQPGCNALASEILLQTGVRLSVGLVLRHDKERNDSTLKDSLYTINTQLARSR